MLTFTTRVRRKATMDLVTESFTKPKMGEGGDNRKYKVKLYQTMSFSKTLSLFYAAFKPDEENKIQFQAKIQSM